jgi:CDGSH-type Zn-finger protein/uncharacterized Fe-S cluster protein YjdI
MATRPPISIKINTNGPIRLKGADLKIHFCGEPVSVEDDEVYLCRCGGTKNPPFCDGTHNQGFVAEPPEGERRPLKVWEGKKLRTVFNANACMHARYCAPLNDLRERELGGDAAAADEIARIVMTCPSGALVYEAKEDVAAPSPGERPDVDIMEGGEVRIQVPFEINAELQENQPTDRATLCRCGRSKNKPWCDGRHRGRRDFR